MPVRSLSEKFLVAFSLAGEDRELVRPIAEAVERELGENTVFFYEWFEAQLGGADGDLKLQRIYGKGCSLAVVCVSERYGRKAWTLVEHAAVRARMMLARTAADKRERDGVLPIRVGEGDVEGILATDLVPDVRSRPATEAAQLVIDRLRSVIPDLRTKSGSASAAAAWPAMSPQLATWPMANHTQARQAFEQLLIRDAPWRCLRLRGSSETGKSTITRQMRRNASHLPDLACGRLDFKGTTDMDAELDAFVVNLEVTPPPPGLAAIARLNHIVSALKQRAKPTLLIFDTYEAASEATQDWVKEVLLPLVIRHSWLRVVIAGQRVPECAGPETATMARVPIVLVPPSPEEWFAFGQPHKPGLTLEIVCQVHGYCGGKASVLAQVFGPAS